METSKSPDYALIYDAIYRSVPAYVSGHTSPGVRTALSEPGEIMAAGTRHLDIGAGPGFLVELLRMPPFRKKSVGADVSQVAVDAATSRLGPGAVFLMENGHLPFEDGSFDLITCFDVLEHLDIQDILLLRSEIQRVSAPEARLICNISLRDSWTRDINGESVHRTIQPPSWWDNIFTFDRYTYDRKESEMRAIKKIVL